MANITTTEAGPAIPEFWLSEALGHLKANLVMGRIVRRDGDDEVQEEGDTVNVTKRGSLTVRDKSEGSPVTADNPSNSKIAVKLDTHKYVSWHLEDNAGSKAVDESLDYVQDGMEQLAEAIESDLTDLYSDIGTSVGSGGSGLSETTVLNARKEMNKQRAPMRNRALMVSPQAETDLLGIDKFTEAQSIGGDGDVIREAQMGQLYGFNTYMSQLVQTTGSSPPTHHNLAFHPRAFMLVTRPMELPAAGATGAVMVDDDINVALRYTRQWDADELKTKHVIDVLYGVQSVDEDRLAVEAKS
jgi:N4-gp56 family major capsid protein